MLSKMSERFGKFACGISPPMEADEDRYQAGLRSIFLLSPSPERHPRRASSPSAASEHDDQDVTATMTVALDEPWTEDDGEEKMASTFPCVAFASEHGYHVFSLAEMRMLDDGAADARPPIAPVLGRRLVPSPYGGTVLATDVCYRHPCHLVDPFTGARAALPDLPVPFSETGPVDHHPDDHPRPRCAGVTDDGLAWDWSPRGVMVARGDTAFFRPHGGAGSGDGADEWTPVHQAAGGSTMTVNYRGGRFFVLERRSLVTTVIDASTLRACAKIPAPPCRGDDIDGAYLAPSSADDAVLLVHRDGNDDDSRRGVLFTEAYHARLHGASRRPPRWARVRDIGDRAVFVDGAHAFTVAAGAAGRGGARANGVYTILCNRVERPCGSLAVAYDVGFSDLACPGSMRRLKIDVGEAEPMWGQPHWIIRRGKPEMDRGDLHA